MNEWMNEWLFPSSYEHQNRGMAHQNIPTYLEDSDWQSKVLIIEQLRRNQAIIETGKLTGIHWKKVFIAWDYVNQISRPK